LCTLFMRPARVLRSAIVLKPSTLLHLHSLQRKRKYRMLFSPKRGRRPGPNAAVPGGRRRRFALCLYARTVSNCSHKSLPKSTIENKGDHPRLKLDHTSAAFEPFFGRSRDCGG
jgi:hypothetical protein